ncbi:glycoside hydrolase family 31 protein [Cylindrobasidium torrendii FP15055 ss-10]|uniref:Glycoside hydrolase family 31 protein n=1 Tax=Cylindrobasidium torrendii FP15055 ss-10 TaxID=1314674 RepID=A0A0D7B6P3_9AGAR|nr:glycoside hydrolase family 31 protein [Cylindrobasidium torrendii FP15055 ss-10]
MLSYSLVLLLFSRVILTAAADSIGIKLQNGFERVYIQPYGENGLRVRTSLMRDPTGNEWSALIDPPLEGPGGNAGLAYDTLIPYNGNGSITNGNIVASVTFGQLSFWRIEEDGGLSALTREFTDTKALPARYYSQYDASSSFQVDLSFTSDVDEQFYGTGQQACCSDASVNKKGQVVDFVNFNSHVTMPLYISNRGYLQLFNMPSQGRLEFGQGRTRYHAQETSVVDYYISTAAPGDYDTLQKQLTSVTGRQPTPPEFLLGYQQSKLRYYSQDQVLEVAQRFHDEQIPVSLLVVDFFAWKYQGDWSFDPTYFPDPAAMAAQVKELTGAEMMVSLWPSVEDASENYLTLQTEGLLATTRDGTGIQDSFNGAYIRLVDSTNPASREFLWNRLNDSYYSKGIHNFWIDQADGGSLGEPFVNNGAYITGIPYARTFTQYFAGTQEAVGMVYPWLQQQAIDEGIRNLTGTDAASTSCPYMSLTRGTWIGGQRYCSYLWSGDTTSDWPVLLQQITAGVSVGASGISSWTLDIGGFSRLNIDTDEGKELYVRWFGMGVFLPYMRTHGDRTCDLPRPEGVPQGNPCPNEPWSYGEDNFEILKDYIALRYQLIPYVTKLFSDLQASGRTILRALYYDFSLSDAHVVEGTGSHDKQIMGEYMFGPRILVAPVYLPGVSTWEVYLPSIPRSYIDQGWTWTHWWSETDFGLGGGNVTVDAPLGEIPVFYLGSKDDIFSGNV